MKTEVKSQNLSQIWISCRCT